MCVTSDDTKSRKSCRDTTEKGATRLFQLVPEWASVESEFYSEPNSNIQRAGGAGLGPG